MRKTAVGLVVVFVALLGMPVGAAAVAVEKSPNDRHSYEYLVLDNALRVLLVSDSQTDQAAASLDVNVGSGADPEGREGLAHFLEHMLFLGTAKYPQAGEYQEFIRTHGGSNNAYTSFDHTNYYFSIDADFLEPALDRFAQFFTAPLFDAEFVERERQAVHSEFQVNLKNDGRRGWSARKQTFNPRHPRSRFMVGSLDTLADRADSTIRDELIRFYDTHYSANLMTLVVVGREPLATLRQWATEKFRAVPSNDAKPLTMAVPLFEGERLAVRLNVEPIKEQRQLSMTFPVPPIEPHYRTKPTQFIGNLLGHEGAGSLLSLLKDLGWAEGLGAGAGVSDAAEATFEVGVELTAAGMDHITDIAGYVFQYIRLIERDGIKRWLYDEQRRINELAFRFQEPLEPIAYARSLAASLHVYEPADVLRGHYMMESFEPALIREYLARLTPDNVLLTVTGKGVETNAATRWYAAPYKIEPIAEPTLREWSTGDVATALSIPAPNVFVPEHLAVEAVPAPSPRPVRLERQDGFELWYQNDVSFGVPRASFYFSVRSPMAQDSARSAVLTRLYIKAVNEQLSEFSYPAELAGLSYSLYTHIRGFTGRLSGYTDKQPLLLERIVHALVQPEVTDEKFALHKQELERALKNVKQDTPYAQTISEVRSLLLEPDWPEDRQLEALGDITADDVRAFVPELSKRVEIIALAHGSVLPERAKKMAAIVRDALLDGAKAVKVPRGRVVHLPGGRDYARQLDVDHSDSAITVYYQGEDSNVEARARFALLAQILSSPFYHELRTVSQLGYVVFAAPMQLLKAPGAMFVVQSPVASAVQLEHQIGRFLQEYGERLAVMDEEEFARHKAGLLTRILEAEKRLTDRTDRYWAEIDDEEFGFDSREQLAAAVRAIDKDGFVDFYEATLRGPTARRLVVQAPGRRPAPAVPAADDRASIADPIEFKRASTFFPRA